MQQVNIQDNTNANRVLCAKTSVAISEASDSQSFADKLKSISKEETLGVPDTGIDKEAIKDQNVAEINYSMLTPINFNITPVAIEEPQEFISNPDVKDSALQYMQSDGTLMHVPENTLKEITLQNSNELERQKKPNENNLESDEVPKEQLPAKQSEEALPNKELFDKVLREEPVNIIKQSSNKDESLNMKEEDMAILEDANSPQGQSSKVIEASDKDSSFNEDRNEDQASSSEGKLNFNEKLNSSNKESSFTDILAHNDKQTSYNIREGIAISSGNERIGDSNAELVSFKISKVLAKDEHHIEVSLTPENLGKMNIRIEEQAEGVSKLIISADSQETLNLLSENIKELQRELREIGIKTDGSTTEFNLNSHNNQSNQHETSGNVFSFLPYKKDEEDKAKIEYVNSIYNGMNASNRLDFRV